MEMVGMVKKFMMGTEELKDENKALQSMEDILPAPGTEQATVMSEIKAEESTVSESLAEKSAASECIPLQAEAVKVDSASPNVARKIKKARRKRKKNRQLSQDKNDAKVEVNGDDCKMVLSDLGNTSGISAITSTAETVNEGEQNSIKTSSQQRKKKKRKNRKNKSMASQDKGVEVQIVNALNSDLISISPKVPNDNEGNLSSTSVRGIGINDNCENAVASVGIIDGNNAVSFSSVANTESSAKSVNAERRKRRRRNRKLKLLASQASGETDLQSTIDSNCSVINLNVSAEPNNNEGSLNVNKVEGSGPQEKTHSQKRRRKRKANNIVSVGAADTADAIKDSTENNDHNIKKMKLSPVGEDGNSSLLTVEGSTPNQQNKNKRNRNRNRRAKKRLKAKLQKNADLLAASQGNKEENGSNFNSRVKVDEENDGIIADAINTSPQPQQQDNNQANKRKKRRNRKRNKRPVTQEQSKDPLDDATNQPQSVDNSQPFEDYGRTSCKKIKTDDRATTSFTGAIPSISIELNALYYSQAQKNEIREQWGQIKEDDMDKDAGLKLIKKPFTCCYAPNFLKNADVLEGVANELQAYEYNLKNNDLYKFSQTSDLKNATTPYIAGLRNFLYGDVRKWLIDVTGIPLNDTVDMGSSKYSYTDVLLCHDDELEGRRIAYILYLVPPWEKQDGGSLDLFTTDEYKQPKDVVESLKPEWNSFAFFEVSPVSFHQVAEVLSQDKVRLSINGWFHGPPIERPPKYHAPCLPLEAPTHIEEEELYSWINPTYLDMNIQKEIRHKFRKDPQIELESFLSEDKYRELAEALRNKSLNWVKTGPANKQLFEVLKFDEAPDIIADCRNFLKSEALFLIISQLTGIKLHKLAPEDSDPDGSDMGEQNVKESSPRVSIDARRWSHGCYTLLRDDCIEKKSALDANLFINVSEKWSQEHGGFISYIVKDEDEELLTVTPRCNSLSLVYRDTETLCFTKHINSTVHQLGQQENTFNSFACVFYE